MNINTMARIFSARKTLLRLQNKKPSKRGVILGELGRLSENE